MIDIKEPNVETIEEYKVKWDTVRDGSREDDKRAIHNKTLEHLFKMYPYNNNEIEVLMKVCCLNDFYSTNILDVVRVMKKIIKINFDERLKKNDITLVDDVAKILIDIDDDKADTKNNKEYFFYSFATKYCCLHEYYCLKDSDCFPIYDKFVVKCLVYFKEKDNFCDFTQVSLKKYSELKRVIDKFREKYGLMSVSYRDLDKYFFLLGKEHFND